MASETAQGKSLFGAETITASTSDPAEFELAVRPWDLLCRPQSAGDFRHHITAIKSRKFVLYRERYNLEIKLQGMTPDGMLSICIPIDLDLGPVVWGTRYTRQALPVAIPGPVDATLGAGYGQLMILIPLEHLRQTIPLDDSERLESAARSRVLHLSPQLIAAMSRWGNRYLDFVESSPASFDNPALVEVMFSELSDFLLQISANLPPPRPIPNLTTRERGLFRATEYLRNRLDTPVSIAQLCRVSGVSERTLQYAFRDEFGISPTEFMRRRRLHAVRQKLITASASDNTVYQTAFEYGFSELGRFAADYRRLFGELPSETLRKERSEV